MLETFVNLIGTRWLSAISKNPIIRNNQPEYWPCYPKGGVGPREVMATLWYFVPEIKIMNLEYSSETGSLTRSCKVQGPRGPALCPNAHVHHGNMKQDKCEAQTQAQEAFFN
jgi:hypothetical protein